MINLKKYTLLLEYTSNLNRNTTIDNLIKNGVYICGIKFKVEIKNGIGASAVVPTTKTLIIYIKNKADEKNINNIIESLKIKYLKDYVIKPTCTKYMALISIPYYLESINIKPLINNNEKALASCKVDEESDTFILNFNQKLTEHLKPLIEYIVIHELCHAKLGNKNGTHTPEFWDLLKRFSPHYKDFASFLNASSDYID